MLLFVSASIFSLKHKLVFIFLPIYSITVRNTHKNSLTTTNQSTTTTKTKPKPKYSWWPLSWNVWQQIFLSHFPNLNSQGAFGEWNPRALPGLLKRQGHVVQKSCLTDPWHPVVEKGKKCQIRVERRGQDCSQGIYYQYKYSNLKLQNHLIEKPLSWWRSCFALTCILY